MKKLYYESDEREFYFVTESPKNIKIEWIEKVSGDNFLDQNVRWDKKMVIKKDNSKSKHCYKGTDSFGGILVYPYRNGQPFYLIPASYDEIEIEIEDYKKLGLSCEYYKKLFELI